MLFPPLLCIKIWKILKRPRRVQGLYPSSRVRYCRSSCNCESDGIWRTPLKQRAETGPKEFRFQCSMGTSAMKQKYASVGRQLINSRCRRTTTTWFVECIPSSLCPGHQGTRIYPGVGV